LNLNNFYSPFLPPGLQGVVLKCFYIFSTFVYIFFVLCGLVMVLWGSSVGEEPFWGYTTLNIGHFLVCPPDITPISAQPRLSMRKKIR
jgi:hypothetical protein